MLSKCVSFLVLSCKKKRGKEAFIKPKYRITAILQFRIIPMTAFSAFIFCQRTKPFLLFSCMELLFPLGFSPAKVLPCVIDVGTNNEALRKDPLYTGLRQPRLTGHEYYEIIDEVQMHVFFLILQYMPPECPIMAWYAIVRACRSLL